MDLCADRKNELSYWNYWWAHQDSNLEPDRYEQRASCRNMPVSAHSASFATLLAQSVHQVFRITGSADLRTVRMFAFVHAASVASVMEMDMAQPRPILLYSRECDIAGQDPVTVARLARRLRKIAAECEDLGITIFGGAHSGDLRAAEANRSRGTQDRMLILASIPGPFDGGDGGSCEDEDGLMRGE